MNWRRGWLLLTLSLYFLFFGIAALAGLIAFLMLLARSFGGCLIALAVAIVCGVLAGSLGRYARRRAAS